MVVTGVDKRRSRGMALTPCPVKAAAHELGLVVTHDLDDVVARVRALTGTVLGVVVAYGRLLPPSILEVMPLVNLHFSLLPRWRGAAPVERAILEGDTETGVCLMRVRDELDAGEIYDCRRVSIGDDDTL
jgi:methionyl-tRNA formyltransferase